MTKLGTQSLLFVLLGTGISNVFSADNRIFQATAPSESPLSAPASTEMDWLPDGRVLEVDQRGFRQTDFLSYQVSQQTWLHVTDSDSILKRFDRTRLGDTQESELELSLEVGNLMDTRWRTRIRSLSSRQAIDRFAPGPTLDRWKQRTYSISHGWETRLARGLAFEIFAGAAQCQNAEEGSTETLPIGGIKLSRNSSWGLIEASLEQEASGSGSMTGIYGSQTERRFEVKGNIALFENVRLQWNCGVALAHGAFARPGMLRTAGVVTAGADLAYRWSQNVEASLGYMHRKMLGDTESVHGVSGPMAFASFNYSIF